MSMTERSRAALFRGLSGLIDEEAVGEMLASIPPDTEVLATKDFVRAEIQAATTRIIVWNIGWTLTLAGLILAAVRFV
jgi:hypothetical protein